MSVYLRAPDGPVITTTRLTLRPCEEGDIPVLRRLWTERDPRVPAHRRIDDHGRPSEADLLQGLRGQVSDEIGILTVVLTGTGEAIGYVGLVPGDQGLEVAFELLSAHRGQGFATESAHAMIGHAQGIGTGELWASVWDWDVASRRVLEKLGFHEVAAVRDVANRATNILVWRRLRDE